MKNFDLRAYITDTAATPFSLVYATDCANDSLNTLNYLLFDCIERHVPLKKSKSLVLKHLRWRIFWSTICIKPSGKKERQLTKPN